MALGPLNLSLDVWFGCPLFLFAEPRQFTEIGRCLPTSKGCHSSRMCPEFRLCW
jgi:hypothetical protein